MATVRKSNFDWNGKPFWGLVQQNGPWESTPGDRQRASMKDIPTIGGGIGVGGRGHAGNANFTQIMTPYQINATGAPPSPSGYAMRSVMMGPVDMKRRTKMGKVKTGLTLAARESEQTGHKMGNIKMENTTQTEPGDIMGPVRTEGTTTFGSTHHIMEMPNLIAASEGRSDNGAENQEINPGNTFHILPVDPIYPSQPSPSSPAALPYSNIYPTLPSPVLPYMDQMAASTINRDYERQAAMGRQIESIDSNYREAEQFTGEEMRATTSTTNVIRSALYDLAQREGVPVEVIYQQAEQYTLPGQEIRQSTETTETEKKIKALVRKYTAKRVRAVLNNLQPVFGPEEAPPGTRRSTGLTAKQSRQNLGKINTRLGLRFGYEEPEKGSEPNRYDELPRRNRRRKKPQMMQVSRF